MGDLRKNRKTGGTFRSNGMISADSVLRRATFDEYEFQLNSVENSTYADIIEIVDDVQRDSNLSASQKRKLISLARSRLKDLEA